MHRKARYWSRHQDDRWEWGLGRGVGRVFRWGLRCLLLRKNSNVPPRLKHNKIVLLPTPDFRDLVRRRMSNLYCPQAYSTTVSHPMSTSRLWIVGIMSVGTESVGIVWSTNPSHIFHTIRLIAILCWNKQCPLHMSLTVSEL